MALKNITITMDKGPTSLELQGELYKAPIKPNDEPHRPVKRVRRTLPAPYRVEPGNYSWRFDVSSGSGQYTLTVSQHDVQGSVAIESFNTADARSLVQFKFTIT
jgi:hypothetical protein